MLWVSVNCLLIWLVFDLRLTPETLLGFSLALVSTSTSFPAFLKSSPGLGDSKSKNPPISECSPSTAFWCGISFPFWSNFTLLIFTPNTLI